ncbi:L-2-hydroxyglutarate oxidase [Paraburkholderia sp. BL6665CI2N2]|uniref:L-2-hydroxyglutarate oxidase n=1 Tax=Paraburkholderia sp. BL6665CI2N2 TaxID=1938806 RepID=UPI001066EB38|nr:L-2-hydroxyglutarate oxidase [Paraburkholderia sp. BL6665CI2N2]TDY22034.1 L-2-hydroxyglutarate oxidase [Paraburkholderia sp. BL6665CI2N2]
MIYDYCIIGGGIVGLATAMKLLEADPDASLVLLEKEQRLGMHQTGHNSGVIHAGIYYAPGSLKAELCRRGVTETKAFCDEHGIRYENCGKLVVATNALEMTRLDALASRAVENGIGIERLNFDALREREPNIVGSAALFVRETAVVDYLDICDAMAKVIVSKGAQIALGSKVVGIAEESDCVIVDTEDGKWCARKIVVCAGLQSDRIARLAGLRTGHQIIPFRGEYFRLPESKRDIVKHLIYPVPDPSLPFLGVHLTRMIDGSVTVGPNAVLGFSREGYGKFSFSAADVAEFARFPGFWRTMRANLNHGLREARNSIFRRGYLEECRKYCPSLREADLMPMEPGIRAQAVAANGSMIHDFLFLETPRMLHVCNAPSPAATSSIPIGEMIARKVCATPSRARSMHAARKTSHQAEIRTNGVKA